MSLFQFQLFQMERRRERVSRGLLLLTLLLLLLCNLLTFHPLNLVGREKKSADEHEGYFTTGDSLNSQKRHTGAENKGSEAQNSNSEVENKAESDEVEQTARQTNKLRLQHLKRACDEVSNASLCLPENNREMYSTFVKVCKSEIMKHLKGTNAETVLNCVILN